MTCALFYILIKNGMQILVGASTYNLCLFKQTCKEGVAFCAAQVKA